MSRTWINETGRHKKGKNHELTYKDHLELAEKTLLQGKGSIKLHLASGLHHYSRDSDIDENTHRIVAGGGGAFLHPTHPFKFKTPDDEFTNKMSFPDFQTSRLLTWRNWGRGVGFLRHNPTFGLLTGFIYLVTAWMLMPEIGKYGPLELGSTIHDIIASPHALAWLTSLLFCFWYFTDSYSKLFRYIAGGVHALTHLLALLLISWVATAIFDGMAKIDLLNSSNILRPGTRYYYFLISGLFFSGGWLFGSLIFGAYLLISLNIFNQHPYAAFSSLAIEDYKSFLKLHIAADKLTGYTIGIRKVPTTFSRPENNQGHCVSPDDDNATEPHLVDTFISR